MNDKENKDQNRSFLCNTQAFLLALFDKLMLASMTVNTYLTYIGFTNNEFYKKHIKSLFIISNVLGLLLSGILAIIFLTNDITSVYDNVCYVSATEFNEKTDIIATFILACINLICITNILLHIANTIKEIVTFRNISDYSKHYYRIIASLFINAFTFLIVILIIGDSLFVNDDLIDLCYIIDALIVDLFYTCNKTVISETKKLFGYKPDEKESTNDELSDGGQDETKD